MKERSQARAVAIQALYELDCTAHPTGEVLDHRLAEVALSDDLAVFTRQIVSGVRAHAEALDQLIHTYAPEWPMDQVAVIDRNVLRLAVWEWAVSRETPMKVAFNEAVEMAKLFGSDSAPRFVNGVLGALAEQQAAVFQFFDRPPTPAQAA